MSVKTTLTIRQFAADLRLARNFSLSEDPTYKEIQAAQRIIASLPDPEPLTMADIEWDNDEHYLAEAVLKNYGRVLMLSPSPKMPASAIQIIHLDNSFGYRLGKVDAAPYASLTPTGRKFKLVLEDESEPVRKLTTTEEIENAPVGTIVKRGTAWLTHVGIKDAKDTWSLDSDEKIYSDAAMTVHGSWTVLEWGKK